MSETPGRLEQLDAEAPVVVCSIRAPSARSTLRRLSRVPAGCGIVEIRGDDLDAGEVAGIVKQADRPLIVTLRPVAEGGGFRGSEEERTRELRSALAAGQCLVDVEWGSPQQKLADGEHAARVILSYHAGDCSPTSLSEVYRSMASTGAARLKIVARASRPGDAAVVRDLLAGASSAGKALACFAMGRAGALTRILAPSWGSWATYGSLEAGRETAAGQFTVDDLLRTYDVLRIGPSTRWFVLVGNSVFGSPSPAMHMAGYREHGIDARFLPLEADELEHCLPLVGPDGLVDVEGLAVTIPFKEIAAARCRLDDDVARAAVAVNTVLVTKRVWHGFNTDGPAVVELVRRHFDPRAAEVAIVGAGGTARAAAAALAQAGSRVTIFNRTPSRAEAVGARLGVAAEGLDRLADHPWDLLVQATPLGRRDERLLERGRIEGRRMILDAVYGHETPLVRDAREAGLAVADGLDLLVAQAVRQFDRMNQRKARGATLRRAAESWLAARSGDLP